MHSVSSWRPGLALPREGHPLPLDPRHDPSEGRWTPKAADDVGDTEDVGGSLHIEIAGIRHGATGFRLDRRVWLVIVAVAGARAVVPGGSQQGAFSESEFSVEAADLSSYAARRGMAPGRTVGGGDSAFSRSGINYQ